MAHVEPNTSKYICLQKDSQRCSLKTQKLVFIFKNSVHFQTNMSFHIQEFIQTLISNSETKMNLCDFFKTIHQKFYSNYDISFMEYFLELTTHEGEFVVHHEKLIEYGIVTSNRSSNMKQKLDALDLVEDVDYSLLRDVSQQ